MQLVNMWQFHVMGLLCLSALTLGDQPSIVIIGAGASGIAAASKLFENGYQNVTILEAENRIGGRVYTTWFDDSWIDVGGQWVHGQTDNIAYELAFPLGFLEVPPENISAVFYMYDSRGCQISTNISQNLVETFFYYEDRTDEYLNGNNGSIGEYFISMLTAEFEKYPSYNETLVAELLKLGDSFSRAEDASDSWYEASARGYLESQRAPGSNIVNWKDRGYGTILDILMKKYPNSEEELPVMNNTLLNSEAVNINYNSTDGKAVVGTSDGKQYVADHVIITLSLGVLKEQYETLFTPQLPESKVKIIKGLGFGTVGKIYISFDRPWWPEYSPSFGLIWESKDRQEYENDPDKKWLLDLNIFSPVEHRPRIICGWITGASVRHMEVLPEDQVFNQTLAHLHRFFGKSYNITKPTGMLRSQWYSNKHFRGAYSFRSMESERADVWADGLAAPILINEKPIVMFAGEATHSRYYSNVHGAIETGFREANRIIDMYKKKAEN